MANLLNSVLREYLGTYRNLLAAENIDEHSVTLSFPLHYASNHRIEINVTKASASQWIISDSGRIMTELRLSGYKINQELSERLSELALAAGVRTIDDYLIMDSDSEHLGEKIQLFVEAAKTIGDVYFVHKERPFRERELVRQVKSVLEERGIPYQQNFKLGGELEAHKFAFYLPPNGVPGTALAVLSSQNTHTAAQVWAFRCDDVKRQPRNQRIRVGIVYDTENAKWSEESQNILRSRADLVLSDKQVSELPGKLEIRH